MTLGTNANLEELIRYSPQEIDFDFILAELKELEEWRGLFEYGEYSVDDVKERISEQEAKVDELSEEIGYLNNRVEELGLAIEDYETEIERLKETIDDMISSD